MNKVFNFSENITFESIDENIFILNIENGKYYKLSKSASLIWYEVEKGRDIDDMKTYLRSKYNDNKEIDNDVEKTISSFIKLGFISDR
jgi:hypothetical protein